MFFFPLQLVSFVSRRKTLRIEENKTTELRCCFSTVVRIINNCLPATDGSSVYGCAGADCQDLKWDRVVVWEAMAAVGSVMLILEEKTYRSINAFLVSAPKQTLTSSLWSDFSMVSMTRESPVFRRILIDRGFSFPSVRLASERDCLSTKKSTCFQSPLARKNTNLFYW